MKPAPNAVRSFLAWRSDCTGVFPILLRSSARLKNASLARGRFAMRFARVSKFGAMKYVPLKRLADSICGLVLLLRSLAVARLIHSSFGIDSSFGLRISSLKRRILTDTGP